MTRYNPCHDHDLMVPLADIEIDDAIKHGVKMRHTSLERGHKDHKGFHPSDEMAMRIQCLGSLAEAVVRKGLRIDAPLTSETFNVPDFPGGIQVRSITCNHYGLRVYPVDPDDWKIIAVVIPKGSERISPYRIPGWILSKDGRRPEWQMDPNGRNSPMWAVPQEYLRDVRELIK